LPIARGSITTQLDSQRDGLQQDGLGESKVIAVDQSLRREVVESEHAIFVLEIGEECGADAARIESERRSHLLQDRLGFESGPDGRPSLNSACLGRRIEDPGSEYLRIQIRDHLELRAILEDLGHPARNESPRVMAQQSFDILGQFTACPSSSRTVDFEHALRDFQPCRIIAANIERNDAILLNSDSDEVGCEHQSDPSS
jgi:hypothetical protein